MKKGLSISKLVYITLVGVLLVSPFSNMMFDIGGSYIAEIPIVILYGIGCLVFGRQMYRVNAVLMSKHFVMTLLLVGIYYLTGLLHGAGLGQCYGDARALIVLSFVIIALLSGAILLEDLLMVGVSSLCLNLIYSLCFASQDQLKMHYPMLFVIALFVYGAYLRNYSWMCLLGALSAYFAITSFYRSFWVVSILIFIMLICVTLFCYRSYIRRRTDLILLAMSIVGLAYVVSTKIVVQYFESNESRYIQSIAKTEEFIKGITAKNDSIVPESDRERNGVYYKLYSNLSSFILPKGLGHKKYLGGYTNGDFRTTLSTIDSGLYFAIFHFGAVSILGFMGLILMKVGKIQIWQGLLLGLAFPYLMTTAQYFVDIQKSISFGVWIYMVLGFRYGKVS